MLGGDEESLNSASFDVPRDSMLRRHWGIFLHVYLLHFVLLCGFLLRCYLCFYSGCSGSGRRLSRGPFIPPTLQAVKQAQVAPGTEAAHATSCSGCLLEDVAHRQTIDPSNGRQIRQCTFVCTQVKATE